MMTAYLDNALLAHAASLSTATLHEASGRLGALPAFLKPLDGAMHLCGRAFPVRCPPGDNLWIHRALAMAEPGDALVVDTGGGVEFGYWGEIMANAAVSRGLAGLVIAGGVRDSRALIALALPTFAACISIRGTIKDPNGGGAVGEPVRIGEIMVHRGDLVLGDADGVVALPAETARWAVPASSERDEKEAGILEQIRGGALTLDVYKL